MFYELSMRRSISAITVFVIVVSAISAFSPAAFAAYSEEQKVTIASPAAFDFLNRVAVTADGSRMVIGAKGKPAAYVYIRSGTTWALEQEVIGSDTVAGDEYGWSVAITSDGSRIVVGAPKQGATDTGAAYVFSRSGSTWTEEQKLTASDAAANSFFGHSVGITDDGSRLVVGARGGRNGASAAAGSAYVFSRSDVTWTEEQELNASDGVASDRFGESVAIDSTGTRVAIGASRRNTYTGAVYVFSRSGVTWTEEQIVTASDGTNYDEFGYEFSVSFDDAGTRLAVGAYAYTGGNYTGAVYVFSRSGVTWTEEQKLLASDTATGSLFGVSTALTGDGATLSIGAYGVGSYQGAGYVFSRVATTWTQSEKITAADGVASDEFGITTAIVDDGSRVFFAAQIDPGANTNQGAVYIYTSAPAATPTPAVGGSCFGSLTVSVSVNGGSATPADTHLFLDTSGMDRDFPYTLSCQTYQISATPLAGYSTTYSGDCATSGSVIVSAGTSKSCTVTFTSTATPSPTPTPTPSATPTPPAGPASPSEFGLSEGDVISAIDSSDPDLYIINASGYKRLFLNPIIFSFYGHLGGWSVVKNITASVRDLFPSSGLFRNCETNDTKVYALEPTGEDTGTLHHINMTGSQALSEDPAFFSKVFCINSNEFTWYPKSPVPYTSLGQVPVYER